MQLAKSRLPAGETFLTRDRGFYTAFFRMLLGLALQNILTYSVNVADNLMLGSYSQTVLAGAAAVNQIQYILQQFTIMGLGQGLVILSSRLWGGRDTAGQQRLLGAALLSGWGTGLLLTAAVSLWPRQVVELFTSEAAVQQEAVAYLDILRWTYLLFITTNLLLASLRSVQLVTVAFRASLAALAVNVSINYCLIFGRFGLPELGIRGAAVGTVTARCVELAVVLFYLRRKDLPIRYSLREIFRVGRRTVGTYWRVSVPCIVSALLFSCATAVQTAIFGHISEDAMAAASAAGTLFQYLKMVPTSAAAAANVWIAKTIGGGDPRELRAYVRTLQMLFVSLGALICLVLLVLRTPVLSLYAMTERARQYAMQILLVQALISVGMAYQMPCQLGIIHGGGDTRYSMISDIIYSWVYTVPLGLLAAFVWHWPVMAVALCLNSDQILKCLTVGIKTNRYTWIRVLTPAQGQERMNEQ